MIFQETRVEIHGDGRLDRAGFHRQRLLKSRFGAGQVARLLVRQRHPGEGPARVRRVGVLHLLEVCERVRVVLFVEPEQAEIEQRLRRLPPARKRLQSPVIECLGRAGLFALPRQVAEPH